MTDILDVAFGMKRETKLLKIDQGIRLNVVLGIPIDWRKLFASSINYYIDS